MCDKPDFDALRAKRNAAVRSMLQKVADDWGCSVDEIKSTFNPDACYCNCPNGPCEHKWDGEDYVSEDECLVSATCSRCGMTAFHHSMRTGP